MSEYQPNPFSALELLTGDPDAGKQPGAEFVRATQSWNRLNKSLTVTAPRNLARAEQARRRIGKLR